VNKNQWVIKITPETERCTKAIGAARNAALKLPNYLLSQMETDLFSAVIVTDRREMIVQDDSNQENILIR
jgi:hypothetical protein